MSTSEYRGERSDGKEYKSVDAEGDLPISSAELTALASQLFAASFRPGPDSPPQSAPVAPRGNSPDLTTGTSAASTAAGASHPVTPPPPFTPAAGGTLPAPTSPGPESTPP